MCVLFLRTSHFKIAILCDRIKLKGGCPMKKGIVSIVGRPNVGKSTLFNKLVQKRVAITEGTPGVTRDRLYRTVEWQNHYFTLIDTGGLETSSEDVFLKNIRKQAELAIDTSDLVLFVVDGRAGVQSEDLEIAKILRRSGKPTLVVVNKIEHPVIPHEVYEFYEMGFEDMEIISAEDGRGLGDLLDKILEYLPAATEDEDEEQTKIAIIGKPNVGKSSLINRLLNEDRMIVTDIAGTTRDAIETTITRNGKEYLFVDTAGLRKRGKIKEDLERYSAVRSLRAIEDADICLLTIDAQEGVSEQDSKILGYAHDNGKASIILVNKWDLIEKDNSTVKTYENRIREELGFARYAPILFISVETGQRVERIFHLIDAVENNYAMRIETSVLNQVLREAVLTSPPPSDKGVRLKIFYMTQVSTRPPKFVFFVNRKDLFHFSYLRYIENRLRDTFHFEGTPIQFEIRTREE